MLIGLIFLKKKLQILFKIEIILFLILYVNLIIKIPF